MQNSNALQKNGCSVNDTACTIDERFERLWQPLKGISIKNIYVSELSYPKSIYYIEGNANVVVVGTCITFKICHGKKPASRQSIDISRVD
jgi:hypothetical protein